MTANEVWRKVPWAPVYEVSDHGRVRKAVNRDPKHSGRCQWLYLKGEVDKDGYRKFRIGYQRWFAHRLVYSVFVGQLEDGLVICHKDGDPLNNRPGNLQQATQHQNIQHKRLHGTWQAGERHPRARFTQEVVMQVRRMLQSARFTATGRLGRGEARRIAEDVGVTAQLVYDLKAGKGWR